LLDSANVKCRALVIDISLGRDKVDGLDCPIRHFPSSTLGRDRMGQPIEAALLCLLGMKPVLLSLQIHNHFSGSFNRDLIVDSEQYPAIPLNCLVDLDTLLTHCDRPASGGSNQATCSVMTTAPAFCFNENLEGFDSVRLGTLKSLTGPAIGRYDGTQAVFQLSMVIP
jgi:hypothetical protein